MLCDTKPRVSPTVGTKPCGTCLLGRQTVNSVCLLAGNWFQVARAISATALPPYTAPSDQALLLVALTAATVSCLLMWSFHSCLFAPLAWGVRDIHDTAVELFVNVWSKMKKINLILSLCPYVL